MMVMWRLLLCGSMWMLCVISIDSKLLKPSPRPPNIILFVADDFGYGDLASYGHPTQEWGAIDEMAKEGVRLTQFYAPAVFCSPSRSSMLTGRLPIRLGMMGPTNVLYPSHNTGLDHSEITIAEALQEQGYTTGMVGKWHLGINAWTHEDGHYLPHTQGFDYTGHILPWTLSHQCDTTKIMHRKPSNRYCFLYNNHTIVQQPVDFTNMTATFIMDAKAFIYNNAEQPFFLYFSFGQTHTPMFNDITFHNKSRRGVYGDQVNEMAWGVGEILKLVRSLSLAEDTFAMFVSDHGPHLEMALHAGNAGPFKGGKSNFYEGGLRVPAIAWWPTVLPSGVVNPTLGSLTDLFATFMDAAGGAMPTDRPMDSVNLLPALKTTTELDSFSANEILYFHCDNNLIAVRYRQFKIYFRMTEIASEEDLRDNADSGIPLIDHYHMYPSRAFEVDPVVFNVEHDPGEVYPIMTENIRDVLAAAEKLVQGHSAFNLTGKPGGKFFGRYLISRLTPCCNYPYCVCNFNLLIPGILNLN